MQKLKRYKLYLLLLICPFLLSYDKPDQRYFDIAKNMEIFSAVYAEVNRAYVDDVNPNKLFKIGLDAMLASLDPYTNYYAEDQIENFRIKTTGQYGGIGSIVGIQDEKILILMPYEGYPASETGLKIGDEIYEVDGEPMRGKTMDEVSTYLKGEADTKLNVKILRHGKTEPLEFTITRAKVNIKNVPYSGMITDKIGYFKLTTFTKNASENVATAVKNLKAEGAEKIIFDLRNNGGGLLGEAINICNLFLPRNKEVVSTRGKLSQWNNTYKTASKPIDLDIPLVILVNGRSASASEIVSGTLQDYDRAVVIGNKTYGKGLVQQVITTGVYNTQVKVTVAKYYIPSGRCIQAIDYSKKDKNGKAIEVPDSLLKRFKTTNGRTVLDGDGIYPDLSIDDQEVYSVLYGLIKKHHIFEYATEYYYTHDKIVEPRNFNFEKEYPSFKKWLSDKDFTFDSPADQAYNDLKNIIENQGMAPELNNALETLSSDLKKAKLNDLDQHKTEIIEEIEKEILSRYYLEEGAIQASFDDDKDITKAVEILTDLSQYTSILGGN